MLKILQSLPEFDPSIAAEFGEGMSASTFLGTPLFESDSLLNLLIRFTFNLLIGWIIVHFLYYRKNGRKDYYTTFLLFSSTMFLLIFLMENVKLQIGFTLGLFAIFGMIRYRTETVPIREMTYLFVIIGMSVINGLALNISIAELIAANLLIIGMICGAEIIGGKRKRATKLIIYDRIDLIVPEKRNEMMEDIRKRTGIDPENIEIGNMDFLKDSVFLKIYYNLSDRESNSIEHISKMPREE